ncbi:hypothetical protein ACHAWT_003718 [Skeletonema menzelii]
MMIPMMLSPRRYMLLLSLTSTVLWLTCLAFSPTRRQIFSNQQQQRPITNENTSVLLFSRASNDEDDDDRSRPNIVKIQSHQDYVNFLQEDDRLCLVKFYASWCKSCKRFGVSFRHLAFEEGDHLNPNGEVVHVGNVRFAEVEYSQCAQLCKTLKVRKLPTVHYYKRGDGKLSELTCKPSQFQLVVDEMNRLVDGNGVDDIESIIGMDSEADGEEGGAPRNANDDSKNITSSSFDEALDNLSQEIMKTIQTNQTTSGTKEKNPWFRF